MKTFEITIQRRAGEGWPVVTQFAATGSPYPVRRSGVMTLDPGSLQLLLDEEYGEALGRAVFRDDVREAFAQALASGDGPLHVLLFVECPELQPLRWERLTAPIDGRWPALALGQRTPFAIHQPTGTDRRFPPIGRPDLRALVIIANPTEPASWGLTPFDVPGSARGVRESLGPIPSDLLATLDGAIGPPTLAALARAITAGGYTLLHLVAHGRFAGGDGEPTIFLADAQGRPDPVPAGRLIEVLARIDGRRGLPRLIFLSTCEVAAPEAEGALGGLAQRLVRDLGVPAVVGMTEAVSVASATVLGVEFYARLRRHGMADLALVESCAAVVARPDIEVPVPALFSRLAGLPLFSLAPDGNVTDGEVQAGLARLDGLLGERAPVLLSEARRHGAILLGLLGIEPDHLAPDRRRERTGALAAIDQICLEATELAFEALANDEPAPAYDPRCPFRGLEAFNPLRAARPDDPADRPADDAAFFRARGDLAAKLLGRLAGHPFLAVLGPSGSGKSSVVLAGLVPELLRREPGLAVRVLKPGPDPVAALAEALTGDGAPPGLVVVDQFEEAFTLCADESRRRAFLDRLLGLVPGCRVVITIRADFCGDCVDHPSLREAVEGHQVLVAPMTADELRAAMAEQAAAVGLRFETGLDATIFEDVAAEPGRMPLLQHALLELWNRRHGRILRADEYQALGRVAGAIARTAESAYTEFSTDQGRIRDLFLRLTRVDEGVATGEARRDSRQRVRLERLVPVGEGLEPTRGLVNRLADRRLLVTTPADEERLTEVEVAHEALIRHWPLLTDWIDADRSRLRARQGVVEAAEEWRQSSRASACLVHQGSRLVEAERLRDDPRFGLSGIDRDYVVACVRVRQLRRLAATVALLAVLVAGWWFYGYRVLVNQSSNRALARMSRERAENFAQQDQPEKAMLWLARAVESAALAGDADLERAVRADLAGRRHTVRAVRALATLPEQGDQIAVSPDGRTLAVASASMATRLVDLETGGLIGDPIPSLWAAEDRWLQSRGDLKFDPDRLTIQTRTMGEDNGAPAPAGVPLADRAYLWDATNGHRIAELNHGARIRATAYGPEGSRMIATAGDDHCVRLWSTVHGRPLGATQRVPARLAGFTFTPSGAGIVTSSDDGLRLWRTEDCSLLAGPIRPETPGQSEVPAFLRMAPDGKTLVAIAGPDQPLSLWVVEPDGLQFHRRLAPPKGRSVQFGPDRTLIFLGQDDESGRRVLGRWDLAKGTPVGNPVDLPPPLIGHSFQDPIILNEDRSLLIDGAANQLLDARTGRPIGPALPSCSDLAFQPKGKGLVLLGLDRTVRVFEVLPPRLAPTSRRLPEAFPNASHKFSTDGGRLAATKFFSDRGQIDQTFQVLTTEDVRLLGPSIRADRASGPTGFTRDGKALLCLTKSPVWVKTWEVSTGTPGPLEVPVAGTRPIVAYRPDGRAVLIVPDALDPTARLWGLDGKPAGPPFQLSGRVQHVEFHPDGASALFAGDAIEIRDPSTGHPSAGPIGPPPPQPTGAAIPGPDAPPPAPLTMACHFVANGRLIDLARWADSPTPSPSVRHQLIDWQSGREVGPTFSASIGSELLVAPDGARYAVASLGGKTIQCFDATNNASLWSFDVDEPIRALSLDPAGGMIVLATGTQVRFLAFAGDHQAADRGEIPFTDIVVSLAVASEPRILAVACQSGPIHLRHLDQHVEIRPPIEITRDGPDALELNLSRDARVLAVSNPGMSRGGIDGTRLIETTTGLGINRPLQGSIPSRREPVLAPDFRTVLLMSPTAQATKWDLATGQVIGGPTPKQSDANAIAIDPDGHRVLVQSWGKTLEVRDLQSDRPIGRAIPGPEMGESFSAVFRPGGNQFVLCRPPGLPTLLDAEGKDAGRSLDHPGAILATFSRDGQTFLTTGPDNTIRLWSSDDGRPLGSVSGIEPTLDPTGRVLLYREPTGPVHLWDVTHRRTIGPVLEMATTGPIFVTTGQGQRLLAAFDPDGRRLITSLSGREFRLWDATTGLPIGAPVRLNGEALAVAFGSRTRVALATDDTGTLTQWDIPEPWEGTSQEIQDRVQVLTGKELDPEDDLIRPLPPEKWYRLRDATKAR